MIDDARTTDEIFGGEPMNDSSKEIFEVETVTGRRSNAQLAAGHRI